MNTLDFSKIIFIFYILFFTGCSVDDLDSFSNDNKDIDKKNENVIKLIQNHVWEGIGEQIDGVSWKVRLSYTHGMHIVSYPSLDCAGELKYLSAPSNNKTAYFEESILRGDNRCLDGLRIEVTKVNETFLKYDVVYGAMKVGPFNNGLIDSGAFSGFNHNIIKLARGKLVQDSMENSQYNASNGWTIERDINGALGNTYAHKNGKGMIVDFYVDNEGKQDKSMIKLYKQEKIQKGSLGKYNLTMNINDVYGESEGHVIMAGYNSSGVAGTFACFLDEELNELGCLAWTDHTNKFVLFHGSLNYGFNELFYTTELNPVMRRGTPHQEFNLDVNLLEEIKNRSSTLYNLKNKINYIKYGAFVSEASIDNTCYKCSSSIDFSEIKLYSK